MIRYQGRDIREMFFEFAMPMDTLDIEDMSVGNQFASDLLAALDGRQISHEINGNVGVFKQESQVLTIGDMFGFQSITRADAIRIRDFVMHCAAPVAAVA